MTAKGEKMMPAGNWGKISTHRDELYGISIVSIMLHHFLLFADNTYGGFLQGFATIYKGLIGSIGVEIFLFLSGASLYYSLSKRPRLVDFYKRRLLRILPVYAVIAVPYWLYVDVGGGVQHNPSLRISFS